MKELFFSIIALSAATSCINSGTITVQGRVTDPALENTKVYYVALDGPISREVDSTIIEGGRFLFEKKADSLCIKILRIPIKNSGTIEDLVTVLEPGKLDVVLSVNSYGKGTRLNDRLQQWKDYKHRYDSVQAMIYELKGNDSIAPVLKDSLMRESAIIQQEYRKYAFTLMNENLYNGIGLLLFKLYYHEMSPEEKTRILGMTGDLYSKNDEQLSLMIKNDVSLRNR